MKYLLNSVVFFAVFLKIVYSTDAPTMEPTAEPSFEPTFEPSFEPTVEPTSEPLPTMIPTRRPSVLPTSTPTRTPVVPRPSTTPTRVPSLRPTRVPSRRPTSTPTRRASLAPSRRPSIAPSTRPSNIPSNRPSVVPSARLSRAPSRRPTIAPSTRPSIAPSTTPTIAPSTRPTIAPSTRPSATPSEMPNEAPSGQAESPPTLRPLMQPSEMPIKAPTEIPVAAPSMMPISPPSMTPVAAPSMTPVAAPSMTPVAAPSITPVAAPSMTPVAAPSMTPVAAPSMTPLAAPNATPETMPSKTPNSASSESPVNTPNNQQLCVSVMMADKFGDWPKCAMMFVYDSIGRMKTYQPTCDLNPLYADYCFDCDTALHGDSVTMLIHGYNIPFYNELFWQIFDHTDNQLYSGDYSTVMKFIIHKQKTNGEVTCRLELGADSENIIANEMECEECLVSDGNANGDDSSGCSSGGSGGSGGTYSLSKKRSKPPPKPKPSPKDVPPMESKYGPSYGHNFGGPNGFGQSYSPSKTLPSPFAVTPSGVYSYSGGSSYSPSKTLPFSSKLTPSGVKSYAGGIIKDNQGSSKVMFPPVGKNSYIPSFRSLADDGKSNDLSSEPDQLSDGEMSSMEMWLDKNTTWFLPNGLGAYYGLYSKKGITTHYYGTMCGRSDDDKSSGSQYAINNDDKDTDRSNGNVRKLTSYDEESEDDQEKDCTLNMLPGNYIYRVDGLFDPDRADIAWKFCGVYGGASTEIHITIDEACDCTVTGMYTLNEICKMEAVNDPTETAVTLSGTFELGGMHSPDLTAADETAIRNSLIKEFSDASVSKQGNGVLEVGRVDWHPASSYTERKLAEQKGSLSRISFSVKLLGERYGLNGLESRGLEILNGNMNTYLSRSMSAGLFVAKLINAAHNTNSLNMQSVNFARLINLKVLHETELNKEISSLGSIFVSIGALIGVTFGVLLFTSFRRSHRYQLAPSMDSDVSVDTSSIEVSEHKFHTEAGYV